MPFQGSRRKESTRTFPGIYVAHKFKSQDQGTTGEKVKEMPKEKQLEGYNKLE